MKNISIPEPCSEDWNKMTPSDKGAFCQKCSLDVYDFTNKSGDEIREVLRANIGSRVCGHINNTQLDELNFDFEAWQMNDKKSFQRAWVFSLFVVFGMTLFSCQAQEESAVEEYQKIGKMILTETEPSDSLDVITELGEIEACLPDDTLKHSLDGSVTKPNEFHQSIKGNMVYREQPKPIEPPIKQEVSIDGGMKASAYFEAYLIDTVEAVEERTFKNVIIEAEMSGIVYPNPTSNEAVFRLVMPKRGKGEILLLAMNGQRIRTIHSGRLKKGQSEFPMDLTDLTKGMYLIVVTSGEMKETIKFSKL